MLRQFPKESPWSAECKWFHRRKSFGENSKRKSLFLTSVWQKEAVPATGHLAVLCQLSRFLHLSRWGPTKWGRWRERERMEERERERKVFLFCLSAIFTAAPREAVTVVSWTCPAHRDFSFSLPTVRVRSNITVALFQLFSVTVRLLELTVGAWYFDMILHSTNI